MKSPRNRLLLAVCCFLGGSYIESGAAERFVWFGSYTGGSAKSEGIYVARFDDVTGRLSPAKLAGAYANPSFLALHPRLPVLYAVSEVGQFEGKPSGAIAAFGVDEATGKLTFKGVQPSGGAAPCHLSVDPSGKVVLAANYVGGSTICLRLNSDGSLQPVVDVMAGQPGGFVQHVYDRALEFGVNKSRQEAPHAHSVEVSPDGRFAIVNDLGLDRIFSFKLDADKGTIEPNGFIRSKTGAGPRRLAFHPDGQHCYAVNELDLSVSVLGYDAQRGELRDLQTSSTLPADVVKRAGVSCAEVVVHPSGKFLYASNRTHDSIARYKIQEGTGEVTFVEVQPIEGAMPRNFAIEPTGKYLLIGGQNSNTVAVFEIDQETGKLSFTGAKIDVPSPVCIVFGRS